MTDLEPIARTRNAARDFDIWQRYTNGQTMSEIADIYELSIQRVSVVIKRMQTGIPIEERNARRRRQIAELDIIREELHKIAGAGPIPAYSHGRPILMFDNETPAEDHTGRMAAMANLIKVQEREARALGTDAKQVVEVELGVRYEIVGVDLGAMK